MTAPIIIIKKIKKGGHGHHGGAWKVAYADFVTAMMAFFLLLWLLNSASEEQLHGIADFFSPTIGLKNGSAVGTGGGGDSSNAGGGKESQTKSDAIMYGATQEGAVVTAAESDNAIDGENSEAITVVESSIRSSLEESKEIENYASNIIIDQTPEGLRIQITEKDGKPMFKAGTAELEEPVKYILKKIVGIVRFLPNYIAIAGHTSTGQPMVGEDGGWMLSAERANATRGFMIGNGLDKEHVVKLIAKADTDPINVEDPENPVNRRISITVLKDAKMAKNKQIDPNIPLKGQSKDELKSYLRIQSKDNPASPEYKEKKTMFENRKQVQGDLEAIKLNQVR